VSSVIYTGTLRHRRFAERHTEFTHRVALAYVDLDEPAPGGRLVRFERADYLGDPRQPLPDAVRDLVEERTGERPEGPIRLLTQLRSFGHCFNPVSFYYCFGGERLDSVVADVTNTPWGERHAYVVQRAGSGSVLKGDSEKVLHVSPFMGMDHRYEWRVADPGETLSVHIESKRDGALAFDATLSMRRRPFSPRALVLGNARVLALIYGHALGLRLRGVGVHPHPEPA
jgi:DUF1365 family protein